MRRKYVFYVLFVMIIILQISTIVFAGKEMNMIRKNIKVGMDEKEKIQQADDVYGRVMDVVNPHMEQQDQSIANKFAEQDGRIDAQDQDIANKFQEQDSKIAATQDQAPKYVATSTTILGLSQDHGIALATDNNHWYYWSEGSRSYVDSGFEYRNTGQNLVVNNSSKGSGTDSVVQLHPENNPNDNIYPNLTDKQVHTSNLDDALKGFLNLDIEEMLDPNTVIYNNIYMNNTTSTPISDYNCYEPLSLNGEFIFNNISAIFSWVEKSDGTVVNLKNYFGTPNDLDNYKIFVDGEKLYLSVSHNQYTAGPSIVGFGGGPSSVIIRKNYVTKGMFERGKYWTGGDNELPSPTNENRYCATEIILPKGTYMMRNFVPSLTYIGINALTTIANGKDNYEFVLEKATNIKITVDTGAGENQYVNNGYLDNFYLCDVNKIQINEEFNKTIFTDGFPTNITTTTYIAPNFVTKDMFTRGKIWLYLSANEPSDFNEVRYCATSVTLPKGTYVISNFVENFTSFNGTTAFGTSGAHNEPYTFTLDAETTIKITVDTGAGDDQYVNNTYLDNFYLKSTKKYSEENSNNDSSGTVETEPEVKWNEIVVNNGQDLNTVLDNITGNNKYNRYVVKVKAGSYNVSSDRFSFGLKNYVYLVGESQGDCFLVNRYSDTAYDSRRNVIDVITYQEAIMEASVKNFTVISRGCKGPVHIDTNYAHFAKGGVITIDNCLLIDENPISQYPGGDKYKDISGGVNVGLLDGQTVIVKNCVSNGTIYAHNQGKATPSYDTGCRFEIHNSIFRYTVIGDLVSRSQDVYVVKGCKVDYFYININNISGYADATWSWDVQLEGNHIGRMIGVYNQDMSSDYALWDRFFGGRFAITSSDIHNNVLNATSETIDRGTLVQMVFPDISDIGTGHGVKKVTDGSKIYGFLLETLVPNIGRGVVQTSGKILYNVLGNVEIGDPLAFDVENNRFYKTTNALDVVAYAYDNITNNSTEKIEVMLANKSLGA